MRALRLLCVQAGPRGAASSNLSTPSEAIGLLKADGGLGADFQGMAVGQVDDRGSKARWKSTTRV